MGFPELRSTVEQVVDLLVDRDYAAVERLTQGTRCSAAVMEKAVLDYGKRLVRPPDDAFAALGPIRVRTDGPEQWSVVMPLWTHEEGLSDLHVSLTLVGRPTGGYRVELDDIHVP
jgi:hypothetical protein